MVDLYANYAALAANEVEGVDYAIRTYPVAGSTRIVIAPHGGGIEPGTSELAQELNRRFNISAYDFDALKRSGNRDLHITSVNFDEPQALMMVASCFQTMALHGYSDNVQESTYVGGLDTVMIGFVQEELQNAGFAADLILPDHISGTSRNNICNKNKKGMGVQLEMSTALRRSLFANNDYSRGNRDNRVQKFYDYVNAIGIAMMRDNNRSPLQLQNN